MSDGVEGMLLGVHVTNDNVAIVENHEAPVNFQGSWSPHQPYALRKHGFFVPPATGTFVLGCIHVRSIDKYVLGIYASLIK